VDEFIQDLEYALWLVLRRPLNGAAQLKALYQRYMHAPQG
jgi:hypothetical protein